MSINCFYLEYHILLQSSYFSENFKLCETLGNHFFPPNCHRIARAVKGRKDHEKQHPWEDPILKP